MYYLSTILLFIYYLFIFYCNIINNYLVLISTIFNIYYLSTILIFIVYILI